MKLGVRCAPRPPQSPPNVNTYRVYETSVVVHHCSALVAQALIIRLKKTNARTPMKLNKWRTQAATDRIGTTSGGNESVIRISFVRLEIHKQRHLETMYRNYVYTKC